MANPEHMELIRQGTKTWNRWREQNLNVEPDFTGAYVHLARLRGANLRGAKFNDARLVYAVFRHSDLRGADLSNSNLHGADLRGADFRGADLHSASLHGADLRGADLRGADLHGADLNRTDLRQAKLHGADFRGTRLQGIHLVFSVVSDAVEYISHIKWKEIVFLKKRGMSILLLLGFVALFFITHQFGFNSLFKIFKGFIDTRFFVNKIIKDLSLIVFCLSKQMSLTCMVKI
jgi:hypothetical protein